MIAQRGISRSIFAAMLAVFFLRADLFGKPKEKVYNNTPQEVFQAALRTARERHVITYVDEKNLMLTFETGTSGFSYGFNANASVEEMEDGKSKLILNVQKKNVGQNVSVSWGAGDRMADKFFKQVEEELARQSSQKTAAKPEAPHVEATKPGQQSSGMMVTGQGGEQEQPRQALTNESILGFIKIGFSDETIVNMIEHESGNYSLGADDVTALRKAGVSEKVITAMSKLTGQSS